MIWQDVVFTVGNVLFAVFLIPMAHDVIVKQQPVNLWTTGLTAVVLYLFNITYATLGCQFAAIPLTSTMWALIFACSYRLKTLGSAS